MVTSIQQAKVQYETWTRLIRNACLAVSAGRFRSTTVVLPLAGDGVERQELMRLAARVVEDYELIAEVDDSGRRIAVRVSWPEKVSPKTVEPASAGEDVPAGGQESFSSYDHWTARKSLDVLLQRRNSRHRRLGRSGEELDLMKREDNQL
jgi:hypothetical protein